MEQNGEKKCGACGHETIPVWMPKLEVSRLANGYICPFCGGTHSLILVGLRSATGISAGISQLYSSKFNDDKKLLAFNDNVQAIPSRRILNARTWWFGLRTAMQHFVATAAKVCRFGVWQCA
jgi:DEAD/DEAH box helicase domain-containing protein